MQKKFVVNYNVCLLIQSIIKGELLPYYGSDRINVNKNKIQTTKRSTSLKVIAIDYTHSKIGTLKQKYNVSGDQENFKKLFTHMLKLKQLLNFRSKLSRPEDQRNKAIHLVKR